MPKDSNDPLIQRIVSAGTTSSLTDQLAALGRISALEDDQGPRMLAITVLEMNDSRIALPGRPPPVPCDPREKFIAQYLMITPQGPGILSAPGATKEEAIGRLRASLIQMKRDMNLVGIESVDIELP